MEKATVDLIQSITSCVIAAFTVGTFGALIWYTIETQKLRLAAQKQNESVLLPILSFGTSRIDSTSIVSRAATREERMIIRNVGSGPAFNAVTESISVENGLIEFQHVGTIAAGEEYNLRIFINDRTVTLDSAVKFWNHIHTLPKPKYRTVITYQAANGAVHKATFTFNGGGNYTVFEKLESSTQS